MNRETEREWKKILGQSNTRVVPNWRRQDESEKEGRTSFDNQMEHATRSEVIILSLFALYAPLQERRKKDTLRKLTALNQLPSLPALSCSCQCNFLERLKKNTGRVGKQRRDEKSQPKKKKKKKEFCVQSRYGPRKKTYDLHRKRSWRGGRDVLYRLIGI